MEVIIDFLQVLKVAPLELPIPEDPRLRRIYKALLECPGDNRSLESWGEMTGASGRTLARRFLAETGTGFRQWRQQLRILEALKRLGQNESVTCVAMEAGYESPSAFIAMFRKALGSTPGQYFEP